MTLKKILKLNNSGSLGVCIPSETIKEMGLSQGDYVNISKVGNTLHLTKVVIQ